MKSTNQWPIHEKLGIKHWAWTVARNDDPPLWAPILSQILLLRWLFDFRALGNDELPGSAAFRKHIEPAVLAAQVVSIVTALIGAAVSYDRHVGIGGVNLHVVELV
jgi:hypothetical protein